MKIPISYGLVGVAIVSVIVYAYTRANDLLMLALVATVAACVAG